MGLAESLRQGPTDPFSYRCRIWTLKQMLSEEDAIELEKAFDLVRQYSSTDRLGGQVKYTLAWIQRSLRENGYNLGKDSLRTHLNKECRCGLG
jgi:hypothetical protein